jgi:hypothetical protein
MRDVNAALCDTLEASVREVGDAVVRHEAAATGALSAAALLGDIMHRIEELMRVVAAGAEPVAGPSTAEATSANVPLAPPTPGAKVVVAALASVTFEAQIVDDIPLPFAREESSLEAPMPAVASQAQAASDLPPAAAAEVSADSAEEQSTEYVAGPLAYASPAPMADLPVSAAVDSVAADGVLSEGAVSTGAMAERTTSEDVLSEGVAPEKVTPDAASVDATETRAFLDALSDELTVGNETLREPRSVGETDDPRSNPVEQLAAATHLQNEINIPAEIVAAQSVPVETVAVESAAAETVAAEAVAAEMVPAETIAAETVAAESVAAELVAAGPADDQDQPIAAPVVVEATAATIPAAMGEGDPNRLPSSAVAGKDATATETVIRRPASDPLAAFYGLSEEELIALFT